MEKEASASGKMGALVPGPSAPEAPVAAESGVVGAATAQSYMHDKGKAPATEEEETASTAGKKRTAETTSLAEEDACNDGDAVDNAVASPAHFFGPDEEGYYDGEEYEVRNLNRWYF